MTPEEKAKELIKKFRGTMTGPGIEANDRNAPVAAALCVQEIIEQQEKTMWSLFKSQYVGSIEWDEWQSVLTSINEK